MGSVRDLMDATNTKSIRKEKQIAHILYSSLKVCSTRVSCGLTFVQGLVYLHSRDPPITHFDIKANNILLNSKGEPKLADFGLAAMGQPSKPVAGTRCWMAPGILSFSLSLFLSFFLSFFQIGRAHV